MLFVHMEHFWVLLFHLMKHGTKLRFFFLQCNKTYEVYKKYWLFVKCSIGAGAATSTVMVGLVLPNGMFEP